ncbi:hypothetical protein HELRODRAFT_176608 [Helobdella robusta]|uniref:G-protein coupled receptors family 1 profile domain-containing protein n=1 Tax=Helobdella robusta TaxID=6412 RepID=T1FAQ3_HELRO|nr:hypothetical protein HELRODRAFT_176608 [Helobdella robusta]ESN99843.1 hypothetical protein HELRODRAFT_176608 [Helobdella robusta]
MDREWEKEAKKLLKPSPLPKTEISPSPPTITPTPITKTPPLATQTTKPPPSTPKPSCPPKQDLTLALIVVVFTFIFCHTPSFIDNILWTIFDKNQKKCGQWLFYYTAVADLLVMLNSSANFIIYLLTSPKFRLDLIQYLPIRRGRRKCGREFSRAQPMRGGEGRLPEFV